MTRLLRLVGLAVVAVVSLTAPAANAADRPFKGVASGAIVALDPDTGAGVSQYTGQATHLGRFTRTESFQLDPAGGISGTLTFTAANGDRLFAAFAGHFVSETTAVGYYEFTGGTGRYAAATGVAGFRAVLGPGGQVGVTFEGTLGY